MQNIANIILVLSGKGGVGKSTVSAQLATTLANSGKRVGILDIDLCGPSIPRIFGVEREQILQGKNGWIPVSVTTDFAVDSASTCLKVMSIGFLLQNPNDAVVWRGPKKTAMIKQFLTDVEWGELDYLIIDTPPGTSDEHLAVLDEARQLNLRGAILVTTPQAVSLLDVRKERTFCEKLGLKVLGVIENMSGYACPHCQHCTNIFSTGGGQAFADEYHIPFFGKLPMDPQLTLCEERGETFLSSFPKTNIFGAFQEIVKNLNASLCNPE